MDPRLWALLPIVALAILGAYLAGKGFDNKPAPEPSIRPGEVRIAVKASSVNPVDWKIVAGRPDMPVSLPAIPGRDAAGEHDPDPRLTGSARAARGA